METFVVRVVPSDDAVLRGVVRRVADGSERTFSDDVELLAFLRAAHRPQTSGTEVAE